MKYQYSSRNYHVLSMNYPVLISSKKINKYGLLNLLNDQVLIIKYQLLNIKYQLSNTYYQ